MIKPSDIKFISEVAMDTSFYFIKERCMFLFETTPATIDWFTNWIHTYSDLKGLIIVSSMYGATIGKVAIAGFDLTTNQACCACTPFNGIYNYYLFYFLKANKPNFIKQSAGGAQPNISRTKIIDTLFPLPPPNRRTAAHR